MFGIMIMKNSKQLEKHFKGIANHWRVEILLLVSKTDNLTVENIANILECNVKTISEHIKKLTTAGLLYKTYKGREVWHSLSPYGKKFVKFIKDFS